jgi:mono/diheme cytochrome c family protein
MMKLNRFTATAATLAGIFVTSLALSAASPEAPQAQAAGAVSIARGEYLVNTMGCHDCHTPMAMTAEGPKPDIARALTGHPEALVMPPAPALPPGPWAWVGAATNTAFAGPWGVSFTANLTPDKETGLGNWTVDQFIETMKTGRSMGKGRPIMPPMPYFVVAKLTDSDIRSLFAYLQSLKPVKNKVPMPREPKEGGQ